MAECYTATLVPQFAPIGVRVEISPTIGEPCPLSRCATHGECGLKFVASGLGGFVHVAASYTGREFETRRGC